MVQHFLHKDKSVPIWAIFEVISLGEFGNFVSCIDSNIKHKISKLLNLNRACDSDGSLTENIIYIIKDLRNAIAHNDIVFDTHFKRSNPNSSIIAALNYDTGINNITFNTITDYLILIVFIEYCIFYAILYIVNCGECLRISLGGTGCVRSLFILLRHNKYIMSKIANNY